MTISVRMVVLAAAVSMGAALPVAAQDASVGYQFQRLSAGGGAVNYPAGLSADISRPFEDRQVALVGQVDWSRKTIGLVTQNLSVFGGGLRWSPRANPRATPFLQGVAGLARTSNGFAASNDFAFQLGGGFVGPVIDSFDWLVQADYRCILASSTTNSVRVVLGIRIPLER